MSQGGNTNGKLHTQGVNFNDIQSHHSSEQNR
jgi:hypothetical protein